MKQSENVRTDQDESFRRDWKMRMHAFTLSEEQKQQMWRDIQQKRGRRKIRRTAGRVLGTAAAVICIFLAGAGGVIAVSGGKAAQLTRWSGGDEIMDTIRKLCGLDPESAQILQNKTPEAEVYAPPLLDCNENRVVFANSRGMVIYDRQQQSVTATIDLQEIGCNYFTVDSFQTKVIIEEEQVRIFNTKDDRVSGSCYVYQLPEHAETVENLKPDRVIRAEDALQDEWEQKMHSRYADTFDSLGGETIHAWNSLKDRVIKYSEYSVAWMSQRQHYLSCLLLQDEEYLLYTRNQDTGENETGQLQISVSGEAAELVKEANTLPEFAYTGEDKILKAICDYLVKEEKGRYVEKSKTISYTFIPAPVIYDIIEEDGEIKVFGNFYGSMYYKNGNILEESSGGEMPACFHLKKESGSYQVVQVEKTGDGSRYITGIRKFCEGHEDIFEKFFDWPATDELRVQMETAMIRQYVTDHQLDIRYYHHFGWDPVEL